MTPLTNYGLSFGGLLQFSNIYLKTFLRFQKRCRRKHSKNFFLCFFQCCIIIYSKHPNFVRTQVEITSDPNYLVLILFERIFKASNLVCLSYFSGNLEEGKVLELRQNLYFLFHLLNTLKLFWFTIDSSVLLIEGARFFFHDICHFLFVSLIV